jgi:tRNA pseudouridine38-40 synthase
MPRIALSVSYNGNPYRGWQTQPGGNTVQDHLESALAQVQGKPVATICAGRTDAGVHGLAQVVHFDAQESRPLNAWIRGTNAYLPKPIVVNQAWVVPESFNARLSASSRSYCYLIVQSPTRPALWDGRAGWVHQHLNTRAMRQAMLSLIGTHDFSSFRSSQCQARTPVRNLEKFFLLEADPYLLVYVQANAFLHHMVRNLVGLLVEIGRERKSVEWATHVLEARNRAEGPMTFAAQGLYLYDVSYPVDFQIKPRQVAAPFPFSDAQIQSLRQL